jgi:hypothetical protein
MTLQATCAICHQVDFRPNMEPLRDADDGTPTGSFRCADVQGCMDRWSEQERQRPDSYIREAS